MLWLNHRTSVVLPQLLSSKSQVRAPVWASAPMFYFLVYYFQLWLTSAKMAGELASKAPGQPLNGGTGRATRRVVPRERPRRPCASGQAAPEHVKHRAMSCLCRAKIAGFVPCYQIASCIAINNFSTQVPVPLGPSSTQGRAWPCVEKCKMIWRWSSLSILGTGLGLLVLAPGLTCTSNLQIYKSVRLEH
jgi:hypothetical protein